MMKRKRFTILFLAAALVLVQFTSASAADDWPAQLKDQGHWVNAGQALTDRLIDEMESGRGEEDFAIVYYNTECANSSSYVPRYYQLVQQLGSALEMTVYGVNYETTSIPFGLFEGYSVSFPALLVYDADAGSYQVYKRVTDVNRFAQLIGVDVPDTSLSQITSDIPVDPTLASYTASAWYISRYTPGDVAAQEWEVLKLVNEERMALGFQPLTTGYALQQAAHARIEDLKLEYRADHTRPNGEPCTAVTGDLYLNERAMGENIARGQDTAEAVVEDWMNSSGHRANILQPMFNHMGAGYGAVTGQNYDTVWEQYFIYHPCTYSDLTVTPAVIQVELGESLADQNAKVEVTCPVHGRCQMPLIDAMCTGLNLNRVGTYEATVGYQELTAPVQIQVVEAPAWSKASDWAEEELQQARKAELIPRILQGGDMTAQMSRREFAAVAVTLYERMGGRLPSDCANPFVDVSGADTFILQAHALGIVKGTDSTHFAPETPVDREQAAVMLTRVLSALGEDTGTGSHSFTDGASISDWARPAVLCMAARGIIQGNQAGAFMPHTLLSRETALLMAVRMYENC